MAITIDLSTLGGGTYTIEDDGTPGNGTSVVRDPLGNIIQTFMHPADQVRVISKLGQNININITDSLTTADFIVGSLTVPSENPDIIQIGGVLTSGVVTLAARLQINEWGSDGATDIVAGKLYLDAATGIGVGGNAIETQVSLLEAESITGGIRLSNINDVTLGGGGGTSDLRGLWTGSSGDIVFTNQGAILLSDQDGVESARSGGNMTLIAIGAAADISSNVNRDALLAVGNIALSTGRDVLFGTVGADFDNDVRAGGSINITAGRDFHIDGFSDMASDDQGLASNGGVTITAGRDILIEDDNGVDASVGVSAVASTGAVVLTSGAGGTLSLAANSSSALFAGAGGVVVNADRILIENDSGINVSSGGSARLTGASFGRAIDIGSATDGVTALELSDAELDRVVASTLTIGGANSGLARVVGALTHTNNNLAIESGLDNVLVQADITTPQTLTLRAAGDVTQSAASFITTGTLRAYVDTPDTDGPGGTNSFLGALALTAADIWGNADADTLNGTAVGDTVMAGGGADFVWAQLGGNDGVWGEAGDDRAYFGAAWTLADSFDGGSGTDVLILQGNYNLAGDLGVITAIEKIRLISGSQIEFGDLAGNTYTYSMTSHDNDVAAGQRLVVEGITLGASEVLFFDGTAETDGYFQVLGGAANDILFGGAGDDHLLGYGGNDVLNGGNGADRLRGFAGADTLTGGAGNDLFVYGAANESSSTLFDTLIGFDPSGDMIDLPGAVTGWTGNITSGHLTSSNFDTLLAAAVNAALQPNSAVLFTPTSGDYNGRMFAVVDANGDGNYTANADFVFEFVSPASALNASSAYFI
ncbi:beta strand repeat-containing protein [Sphingomonas parva]|nr:calcium-binding protein [Sphingomonas parva]